MIKISINDIDLEFFTECTNFSKQNPSPLSLVGIGHYSSDERRKCNNGTLFYPPEPETKLNKKTLIYKGETCPVCKGSGFIPSRELLDFIKLTEIIKAFYDPNITNINKWEIPHQFTPNNGEYY